MARLTLAQWRQQFSSHPGQISLSLVSAFLRDAARDGVLSDVEKAVLAEFASRFEPQAKALYQNAVGINQGWQNERPLTELQVFAGIVAGQAVLKQGDRGPGVRKLQEVLIRLDFGHWTPTELFGTMTAVALKEFQSYYNASFAGTLLVNSVLDKATLEALAKALKSAGRIQPNGADQADVIIDLRRQRAYIYAALVNKEDIVGLVQELKAEGGRVPNVYKNIIAKVAPNGQLIDDFEAYPVVSEHQLGLKDSDNQTRMYVSFIVGSGKASGSGYLTPTGTFVIGERLVNREAARWEVPSGFNKDPRNPFGPRFLRLNRVVSGGRSTPTAYGLHGTTSTATWMNDPDGARAVSHGCVRLPNDVIVRLDKYLQPKAVVKIVNGIENGSSVA
ncbi:murein L,D-transpeptidase [Desulfobulbus sp. F1]|nr:murein L,D-transpeptidase [Desulfobulbus sp. F1]